MPNGIDWKQISGESTHPLEKIRPLLTTFAEQNHFKLHLSSYHDGLHVVLQKENRNSNTRNYVRKAITIGLISSKDTLLCGVHASINIHYGLKELIYFIPFVRQLREKWPRRKLVKEIGVLGFPLKLTELTSLLEQGKKVLDEFDHERLLP